MKGKAHPPADPGGGAVHPGRRASVRGRRRGGGWDAPDRRGGPAPAAGGAGVFLLVKTCTLFGAFQLLLEEGDYRRGRKLEDQRNEAVSTIYWCAVTAVYLAWSFLSGDWHITWVVWPVAGVFWG